MRHQRRVFRGKAFKPSLPSIDPNSPSSPDYAKRHRQFSSEMLGGFKRIDIGAPPKAPGRKVEQVSQGEPQEPEAPQSAPAPTTINLPQPAPAPKPEPDWRKDYGLRKES